MLDGIRLNSGNGNENISINWLAEIKINGYAGCISKMK